MKRIVRIERGLIPLIDVFALLIGATIALLARADFDKKKREGQGESFAQLVVSCRIDGRCFYQGEIVFEEGAITPQTEAKLLGRMAQEPNSKILLKIPPPEDASSLFRYTDLQLLQSKWGSVEVVF
jgi:hypothetical protein